MQNFWINVVRASLAGVIGWRALSPNGRDRVLQVLREVAEGLNEAQQNRPLVLDGAADVPILSPITPGDTVAAPELIGPGIEGDGSRSPDGRVHSDLTAAMAGLGKSATAADAGVGLEPDARWRSVVVPPALVMIVGKRGSGKSALGYRLLELFRSRLTPYVVGVPSGARKLLPEWIGIIPSLEDLPPKSISLVDEAYIAYHSRHSMASESKAMSQALNLSRQRDQTLIFVSQEARQVDRNVASSASVIVFKELGMLQLEFERPELRRLVGEAKEAFGVKGNSTKQWSYVYSPDADFAGLLENELPSFWKPGLSRLFASGGTDAEPRVGTRLTPAERAIRARELRDLGYSLSEISRLLGVSKSTVVNYVRGYPYR